jgi:hypothetical protein
MIIMKHIKPTFLYFVAGICILLFSCKKMLTPDAPINQLTTQTVFKDAASAEAAVVGLYGRIVHTNNSYSFLTGNITLYPALSADELYRTTAWEVYDEFTANTISVGNGNNYLMWLCAYREIYHANALLYNLALSPALAQPLKDRLSGEVKFLRALHYFYLVNCFGAVPLPLTPDYENNAKLQRADSAEVYRAIINDLQQARTQLPRSYLSARKVRANYWAATALLARVQLYLQDWEKAASYATELLEEGPFALTPPDKTFQPDNEAAIFQFFPNISSTSNTIEGYMFIPAAAGLIPDYDITPGLHQAFEPGDARAALWIKNLDINGVTYRYPYKYKIRELTPITQKQEYNIVLRLAEQYLVRAEARAHLKLFDESVSDLDSVRSRAGLPLLKTADNMTPQQVLEAVYHERQTELFCEWGHRWFDLKRTGRATEVLAPVKSQWTSTAVLFPIPQSERLSSPLISQNPGYNP